jgi:uncharacterized protein YndB with AHSA1/START domain
VAVPGAPGGTEVVEHEVRVAAGPEVVFEYFTDPAKLVRWMGIDATLDPRPGGVCRIDINGVTMLGEFVEVDFPSRVVFTWGWERRLFGMPPQSTAVEVSLTPYEDGTVVRLVHRRLPSVAVAFHSGGWRHFMDRLALAATGGEPGPDPWATDPEVAHMVRRGLL